MKICRLLLSKGVLAVGQEVEGEPWGRKQRCVPGVPPWRELLLEPREYVLLIVPTYLPAGDWCDRENVLRPRSHVSVSLAEVLSQSSLVTSALGTVSPCSPALSHCLRSSPTVVCFPSGSAELETSASLTWREALALWLLVLGLEGPASLSGGSPARRKERDLQSNYSTLFTYRNVYLNIFNWIFFHRY